MQSNYTINFARLQCNNNGSISKNYLKWAKITVTVFVFSCFRYIWQIKKRIALAMRFISLLDCLARFIYAVISELSLVDHATVGKMDEVVGTNELAASEA